MSYWYCFQFSDDPHPMDVPHPMDDATPSNEEDAGNNLANSDSFDFLGQEMADLQQLLVSMVTGKTSYLFT